ncbi:MAG: polyprenyl synthetase family protein [Bacteroidales bacterium]|nr:polyprenyl synthetase family protein [Bacteroidales bacterium]
MTLLNLPEIQKKIDQLFTSENFRKEPIELYNPIDYTLKLGGKRIRPAMLLAACQMFGGDIERAYNAAIGIEVVHNFTLLHDDLMDRSPLRRGLPTVYTKWDENTAILSGDAMLILAYQYLTKDPHDNIHAIINTFNDMACEVMKGQQYDLNFEHRSDVSAEEYLDMIHLKTAALFIGALRIGGLIAHANAQDLDYLETFGHHLGLAFQIQDDMLDTFGDEAKFGKKPGQDIRDNKKTILLITALKQCTQSQQQELASWLQFSPADSDEKVHAVREIYNQLDIPRQMNQLIAHHYQMAQTALRQIEIAQSNKASMQQLMEQLLHRNK